MLILAVRPVIANEFAQEENLNIRANCNIRPFNVNHICTVFS